MQDDWTINDRLTLNLGVRYDVILNAFANEVEFLPFLEGDRPNDTDNIQPRVGFAYKLDDRTVLRGGVGRYYGDTQTNMLSFTYSFAAARQRRVRERRPGRLLQESLQRAEADARPGAAPLLLRATATSPDACCAPRSELAPYPGYDMDRIPNSWQGSVRIPAPAHATTLAVEMDYVQTNTRNEKTITGNINLASTRRRARTCPYANRATRPFPDWGIIGMTPHSGWSDYHGLQMAFTKRFSDRWQASGNYLLSKIDDSLPNPVSGLAGLVPFEVAPDLGEDYGAVGNRPAPPRDAQRDLGRPWGFQVSGLYFYGSGERQQLNPGNTDPRDLGSTGDYPNRRRVNGDLVPRNSLRRPSIHRVDCVSSSGFRSARASGSTASSKCSTSSTGSTRRASRPTS